MKTTQQILDQPHYRNQIESDHGITVTGIKEGMEEYKQEANNDYQQRVGNWLNSCFGEAIGMDKIERNYRFLEEALELVQSLDCTKEDAHRLVEYVFNRPIGEPYQEVGGVMVTLAALSFANGLDVLKCGETEYDRISVPAIMDKIRAKQVTKEIAQNHLLKLPTQPELP